MNMIALDKLTRGISLWREDVIKFGEVVKGKTLSQFLRDYLHDAMSKHNLSRAGKARLRQQLDDALVSRRSKHPQNKQKRRRTLTLDPIHLGKNPEFVKLVKGN